MPYDIATNKLILADYPGLARRGSREVLHQFSIAQATRPMSRTAVMFEAFVDLPGTRDGLDKVSVDSPLQGWFRGRIPALE